MKKLLIIISILLINIHFLYPQDIKKIYIVDDKGIAIPFVNIKVTESYGVITDLDGGFILNTKFEKDSIIYISHIAYETQKMLIKTIEDTIRLCPKQYTIDEVVCSNVNIAKLIRNTFNNVQYKTKINYLSTRLMAINDSLVYYTEKSLKLIKIGNKEIETKVFNNIYYNSSTKYNYNISLPFVSTLQQNPYITYNSEKNILKLIESLHIEKIYDDYYTLKSATDSSTITIYINRKNGKLIRFEKSIPERINGNSKIGKTDYSYDFEIFDNNLIAIKSFKYQTSIYPQKDSLACIQNYFSDILTSDYSKNGDTIFFKTLTELKLYKQKQKIIDIDLYKYFNNKNFKLEDKKSVHINHNSLPFYETRTNYNKFYLEFPKCNFMAIYNKSTNSYDYYPSEMSINFNLYSPRVTSQFFSQNKVDSFNPYGTNKPQKSILLGAFNLFLQKIQK